MQRFPLAAPLLTACVLAVGLAAPSGAARFSIDLSEHADSVFFRSTASLEFIEGKTAAIEGWFDFDPEQPTADAAGLLRVDLRSLKTGIDLRDEHMRDRHLETEIYPYAFFQFVSLDGIDGPVEAGRAVAGRATGWFFIHGVKRQLEAEVEFIYDRGKSDESAIDATVRFTIRLDDYKIKRPKALFLKLAETIEVEVVFHAQTNREPASFDLPEWPETD